MSYECGISIGRVQIVGMILLSGVHRAVLRGLSGEARHTQR